jgi:hypothetical protein
MSLAVLLVNNSGVGPESIAPQAIVIGIIFVILSGLAPRKTPEILAKFLALIIFLAALLMLYEKGYGMMALVGIVCGLFLSVTLRGK